MIFVNDYSIVNNLLHVLIELFKNTDFPGLSLLCETTFHQQKVCKCIGKFLLCLSVTEKNFCVNRLKHLDYSSVLCSSVHLSVGHTLVMSGL